MPRQTKPLHLYAKFLELLTGNMEWGETDNGQVSVIISRKFKLSKKDIRIVEDELQEMKQITTKKRKNGPTSIFIKRPKVS